MMENAGSPRGLSGACTLRTTGVLVDLAHQAGEHRARAHFDIGGDARRKPGIARMSSQRTGLDTCAISASMQPRPVVRGAASTLAITGTRGSCAATARSSGSRRSPAGAISAQWNGALTFRGITRLAPRALAHSPARATAAAVPAITICPAPFRLAGLTTSPCAASAHAWPQRPRRGPGWRPSRPSRPARRPACSDRGSGPGARHRRTSSVPAATCAEYSPRLWPATNAGVSPRSASTPPCGDTGGENRRLRVLGEGQAFRPGRRRRCD